MRSLLRIKSGLVRAYSLSLTRTLVYAVGSRAAHQGPNNNVCNKRAIILNIKEVLRENLTLVLAADKTPTFTAWCAMRSVIISRCGGYYLNSCYMI